MGVFDPDRHDNLIGITDLVELNEREAAGFLRAQEYLLDLDLDEPIDARLLLHLHRLAFGGLYGWAGKWRTEGTNIGIDAAGIPFAIAQYSEEIAYRKTQIRSDEDLLHILAFAHHRLTQIHPFWNGNGRSARLTTDLLAMQHGFAPVKLYVREDGSERAAYKAALRAADDYDLGPLRKLLEPQLKPIA